MNFKYFSFRLV